MRSAGHVEVCVKLTSTSSARAGLYVTSAWRVAVCSELAPTSAESAACAGCFITGSSDPSRVRAACEAQALKTAGLEQPWKVVVGDEWLGWV